MVGRDAASAPAEASASGRGPRRATPAPGRPVGRSGVLGGRPGHGRGSWLAWILKVIHGRYASCFRVRRRVGHGVQPRASARLWALTAAEEAGDGARLFSVAADARQAEKKSVGGQGAHGARIGGLGQSRVGAQGRRNGPLGAAWPVARALSLAAAGGELRLGHLEVEGTGRDIDGDQIAVGDQGCRPPAAASGETWPTDRPELPPEKRPSVTTATEWARPRPLR